jgi:hypothetical protein
MKIRAWNQIPGTVKSIKKGPVSTEVVMTVTGGIEICLIDHYPFCRTFETERRVEGLCDYESLRSYGRNWLNLHFLKNNQILIEPGRKESIEVFWGVRSTLRVKPDLDILFARKGVDLEQTELVNDVHRAGCGVPDEKVFVPQECLDIIICDRTWKPVYPALPARKGRDWVYNGGIHGSDPGYVRLEEICTMVNTISL